MEQLAFDYVNELADNEEFKRLLELKKIIDDKYSKEIVAFKTAESNYLEAKKYGEYYPNLKEFQNTFSEKKKELYSKEEVKEYLRLEREINESINNDIKDLKELVLDPIYDKKNCDCR